MSTNCHLKLYIIIKSLLISFRNLVIVLLILMIFQIPSRLVLKRKKSLKTLSIVWSIICISCWENSQVLINRHNQPRMTSIVIKVQAGTQDTTLLLLYYWLRWEYNIIYAFWRNKLRSRKNLTLSLKLALF
jgi:hypothetical protein